MSIRHNTRAMVVLAILGTVAVFAVGFFVALSIRSVVAGGSAAPLVAPPNPGHSWSEIGDLPGTMWHSNSDGSGSGLDADLLDGMHAGQSGTDYIPYADASGNVGIGTTSPGSPLDIEGNAEIKGSLQVETVHGGGQVSIDLMPPETVLSSNTPVTVPDGDLNGITDTITFPDIGIAHKIAVSVDISNSDIAGIEVILTDPNGDSYTLHDGGSSGPQLVTSYPNPTPTVSGDLTTWIGQNPQGDWVLKVVDFVWDSGLDGRINSWSISIVTGKTVQITNGDFVVDGNVGIGTDSPGARLEVSSVMRLTPTDSPGTCDASSEGSMYYDASLNEPCFCDGSAWKQFDGGGGC